MYRACVRGWVYVLFFSWQTDVPGTKDKDKCLPPFSAPPPSSPPALLLSPHPDHRYHKPARSGSNGGSRSSGGSNSSGSNVCPFGARCFYAHLDENGNDVKDRTPPAPPPSSRRTCPYLRGGEGGGGSRGGARGGGGGRAGRVHGFGASGGGGLDDLHFFYPFEGEGEAVWVRSLCLPAVQRTLRLWCLLSSPCNAAKYVPTMYVAASAARTLVR